MERWSGKIAIVTGASSGIGWAIVRDLVMAGMQVVGLARRLQQMESLRITMTAPFCDAFHPRECDLSSLASIKLAFQWIEQTFGKVNVLINNAGMSEHSKLLDEGNEQALKKVVDVNLMGSIYCTKEAYRLMEVAMEAKEECHVISVNSLLGHTVPLHIPAVGFNLYPVTKHALRATNEVLRREMFKHKLLRLSSISPGLVETDFGSKSSTSDHLTKLPDNIEKLQPEDVSRGVIFILSSPAHVTIAELLMVPSREEY